jgi:hypothetical protein
MDAILGMGNKALLSPSLLERLHSKGLHFLFQIKSPPSHGLIGETWVSSSSLELDIEHAA